MSAMHCYDMLYAWCDSYIACRHVCVLFALFNCMLGFAMVDVGMCRVMRGSGERL